MRTLEEFVARKSSLVGPVGACVCCMFVRSSSLEGVGAHGQGCECWIPSSCSGSCATPQISVSLIVNNLAQSRKFGHLNSLARSN